MGGSGRLKAAGFVCFRVNTLRFCANTCCVVLRSSYRLKPYPYTLLYTGTQLKDCHGPEIWPATLARPTLRATWSAHAHSNGIKKYTYAFSAFSAHMSRNVELTPITMQL